MKFNAVIFDMDGVLIDSEPLWQEAEIEIFANVGVVLTPALCREVMGKRIDEVVKHWYTKYPWSGPSVEEVELAVVERLVGLIREKGEIMTGVESTLNAISQKGIPIGLATSSHPDVIDAVLEKLSIRHYFTATHSAFHEQYGKPHPGVYISTAKKLNVKPEECIAIEDSPNGVLSAKAAHMYCIAVPDKEHKTDERILTADIILDSLEQLNIDLL
jgi:HAD superfamily hydrolase (TIGR01509 family)